MMTTYARQHSISDAYRKVIDMISNSTTDHEHTELNCETCTDRWLWSQQDA